MGLFAYIDWSICHCQFTACGVKTWQPLSRQNDYRQYYCWGIWHLPLIIPCHKTDLFRIHPHETDKHGRNIHNAAGALVCIYVHARAPVRVLLSVAHRMRIEPNWTEQSQRDIQVRAPEAWFSYTYCMYSRIQMARYIDRITPSSPENSRESTGLTPWLVAVTVFSKTKLWSAPPTLCLHTSLKNSTE